MKKTTALVAKKPIAKARSNLARPGDVQAIDLAKLIEGAQEFAAEASADNTRRAYRSDWKHFATWAIENDLKPMPADGQTVALYLTYLAKTGHKTSTIERHLVSISQAHKTRNLPSPREDAAVQAVRKGIRRKQGVAQTGKDPVLVDILREMVRVQPDGLRGLRNKAMLTLGFALGSRRSELVGIDVTDLRFVREGLIVTIRKSKTDQEGRGRQVAIPHAQDKALDPVRAVKDWIDEAHLESGPVFRKVSDAFLKKGQDPHVGAGRLSDRTVARTIKDAVKKARAGDPKLFAGHSLRSGLVTEAARAGKSMIGIKKQTGHKSDRMVERYIRDAELFAPSNAFSGLM